MNLFYIALGSALGGVCRYALSQLFGRFSSGVLPLGTFIVNVVGCLIIGFLFGCVDRGMNLGAGARMFLVTGFCGGFTTFSTFAPENYLLLGNDRGILIAGLYAALSFFAGLLMVCVGHRLGAVL